MYTDMETEGHGDSLGVWFQISWLINGNFFVLLSKLSHCLLPLKLQAKFPLTSEEVGWRQWGSYSLRSYPNLSLASRIWFEKSFYMWANYCGNKYSHLYVPRYFSFSSYCNYMYYLTSLIKFKCSLLNPVINKL